MTTETPPGLGAIYTVDQLAELVLQERREKAKVARQAAAFAVLLDGARERDEAAATRAAEHLQRLQDDVAGWAFAVGLLVGVLGTIAVLLAFTFVARAVGG